jgi:hypothetical protein
MKYGRLMIAGALAAAAAMFSLNHESKARHRRERIRREQNAPKLNERGRALRADRGPNGLTFRSLRRAVSCGYAPTVRIKNPADYLSGHQRRAQGL